MNNFKEFSSWNSNEVIEWLNSIGLSRYSSNFEANSISGYDLCYLTNEDFKNLGISNPHDKNVLVRYIRLKTLEELKLEFSYDNRIATIQLDFDSNFSVFELEQFIKDIFKIESNIHLSTESNEMLCPNIKIIELILLNPQKYRSLKIINKVVSSREKYTPSRKIKIDINNPPKTYDDISRISFDENKKVSDNINITKVNDIKPHSKNFYNDFDKNNKKSYTPSSSSINIRKNNDIKIKDNDIIYSMRENNNYINHTNYNFKNNKPLKYGSSKYMNTNNSINDEYSENSHRDFERKYIIKQRDFYHEKSAMRQKPGILFNNNFNNGNYTIGYNSSSNSEENYDFRKENHLNYDYKTRNNVYDNNN